MSATNGTSEPEDRAGLYVLGALHAEEMRAVRVDADRDPAVAAAIVAWEKRLSTLAVLAPVAEVPAAVWPELVARAGPAILARSGHRRNLQAAAAPADQAAE